MPDTIPPNMRAALAYARTGWSVFPVAPGGKGPAIRSAHPDGDPARLTCTGQCGRDGHGFHDADTDPDRIAGWFATYPDRNVGIRTGAPGPDVLDIDRHDDGRNGFPALAELRRAGLLGEPRAMIRTPGNGAHLYYAGSDQASGKSAARAVDFKAAGGYVLAPPSSVGGKPYVVVEHQAEGSGIDWGAVKQHIDPEPERKPGPVRPAGRGQNLDHLVAHVAKQQEGNRGLAQWWAAHRAIEAGRTDLLPALAKAAESAGRTAREAEATNRSALRSGQNTPARETPQRETVQLTRPAAEGRQAARQLAADRDAAAEKAQRAAAADTAQRDCTLADPCQEQDCGPCYPDRVMQQEQAATRPFEQDQAPQEMEAAT